MKHSIQRQLLVVFAASLTISTIVCAYFSYRSTYDMDGGGMGLGFIRALPSDASWRYENGQNVLTLRFA